VASDRVSHVNIDVDMHSIGNLSMTIADQIYTLVKAFPPEQASEVLLFAEFVRTKFGDRSHPTQTIAPKIPQSVSFKASLMRLQELTEALPSVDPVALIQAGRDELDERGCV